MPESDSDATYCSEVESSLKANRTWGSQQLLQQSTRLFPFQKRQSQRLLQKQKSVLENPNSSQVQSQAVVDSSVPATPKPWWHNLFNQSVDIFDAFKTQMLSEQLPVNQNELISEDINGPKTIRKRSFNEPISGYSPKRRSKRVKLMEEFPLMIVSGHMETNQDKTFKELPHANKLTKVIEATAADEKCQPPQKCLHLVQIAKESGGGMSQSLSSSQVQYPADDSSAPAPPSLNGTNNSSWNILSEWVTQTFSEKIPFNQKLPSEEKHMPADKSTQSQLSELNVRKSVRLLETPIKKPNGKKSFAELEKKNVLKDNSLQVRPSEIVQKNLKNVTIVKQCTQRKVSQKRKRASGKPRKLQVNSTANELSEVSVCKNVKLLETPIQKPIRGNRSAELDKTNRLTDNTQQVRPSVIFQKNLKNVPIEKQRIQPKTSQKHKRASGKPRKLPVQSTTSSKREKPPARKAKPKNKSVELITQYLNQSNSRAPQWSSASMPMPRYFDHTILTGEPKQNCCSESVLPAMYPPHFISQIEGVDAPLPPYNPQEYLQPANNLFGQNVYLTPDLSQVYDLNLDFPSPSTPSLPDSLRGVFDTDDIREILNVEKTDYYLHQNHVTALAIVLNLKPEYLRGMLDRILRLSSTVLEQMIAVAPHEEAVASPSGSGSSKIGCSPSAVEQRLFPSQRHSQQSRLAFTAEF